MVIFDFRLGAKSVEARPRWDAAVSKSIRNWAWMQALPTPIGSKPRSW